MLERTHLELVQAVDQYGTLTAAADALCLTQSALSHTVKKLEDHIGGPIWRREGRRLCPTPIGHELLALAQRVLPQLQHTEARLRQLAKGERGTLRVGMECHPCHQWLLKRVGPYLAQWPDVDVDVRQKFQFGGLAALLNHDIDVLVTPDPVHKPGVQFCPVFDYEQVLVVPKAHSLTQLPHASPEHLASETLLTYPVPLERLDVFALFLLPAQRTPARHKTVENTDILLHMVASGRGVAALPRWLVDEYAQHLPVVPVQLGPQGLHKHIHLGLRTGDVAVGFIQGFVDLAQADAQRSPSTNGVQLLGDNP